MRVFLALFLVLGLLAAPAIAQEEPAAEQVSEKAPAKQVANDDDRRRALAEQMHKFRPVREQINRAIDQYAQTQAPNQREGFKTAMRNVLNYRALEKISTDAYAETFTLKELEAMVEYYSKPEARSASDKFDAYAGIVFPEITRMLDKALIRVRTGGQ